MFRRSFIKSLAALSVGHSAHRILGADGSLVGSGVQMNILNVYVHGLFAYIFNSATKKIEAHAPLVYSAKHKHVYKAGSLVCGNPSALVPLTTGPAETYALQLNFNTPDRFPIPCYDSAAWLPATVIPKIDTSQRACLIYLPPTILLRPAHRVKRNDGLPFFKGKAVDYGVNPQYLARTFVLTYISQTPFQPAFIDKTGQPIWTPSSTTDALHIFAEPADTMQKGEEDQARQAFDNNLRAMLGNPTIYFVPFAFLDFDKEKAPDPNEEKSLGELSAIGCLGMAHGGGEVANCVGVFVTP